MDIPSKSVLYAIVAEGFDFKFVCDSILFCKRSHYRLHQI
jgi:hypothetical protein